MKIVPRRLPATRLGDSLSTQGSLATELFRRIFG